MWVGELPNEQTPPGATRAFNSVKMLRGARVQGIGIAADNKNEGEFLTRLWLIAPNGKAYQLEAWADEQRTRAGHIEVVELDPLTNP
jgi:hypothetical protein